MDPEWHSIKTQVWLGENPVFSLNYIDDTKIVYTDITGFRPDPSDYLKQGVKYPSILYFAPEKDYQNEDQWILRKVEIVGKNIRFVYIR